jgi:hypothetical protein
VRGRARTNAQHVACPPTLQEAKAQGRIGSPAKKKKLADTDRRRSCPEANIQISPDFAAPFALIVPFRSAAKSARRKSIGWGDVDATGMWAVAGQ